MEIDPREIGLDVPAGGGDGWDSQSDAITEKMDCVRWFLQRKYIQKWQEMLVGWHGQVRMVAHALVRDHGLVIAGLDRIGQPGVEFQRPVKGGVFPDHGTQVMDHVAAAEDQNTLAAQVSQFLSKLIVISGRLIEIEA